jgi:hypothetical protein
MLVLLATPLGARSADRLTMRVSPTVPFAPADLSVKTTVDVNVKNRSLQIIVESQKFYRSSEIPLDGDNAPRETQVELRGLPSGLYTIAAILKGANGASLAQLAREVNVVTTPRSR